MTKTYFITSQVGWLRRREYFARFRRKKTSICFLLSLMLLSLSLSLGSTMLDQTLLPNRLSSLLYKNYSFKIWMNRLLHKKKRRRKKHLNADLFWFPLGIIDCINQSYGNLCSTLATLKIKQKKNKW